MLLAVTIHWHTKVFLVRALFCTRRRSCLQINNVWIRKRITWRKLVLLQREGYVILQGHWEETSDLPCVWLLSKRIKKAKIGQCRKSHTCMPSFPYQKRRKMWLCNLCWHFVHQRSRLFILKEPSPWRAGPVSLSQNNSNCHFDFDYHCKSNSITVSYHGKFHDPHNQCLRKDAYLSSIERVLWRHDGNK